MRVHTRRVWRLFIDSLERNLKCVLLNSGKKYDSIQIGHCISNEDGIAIWWATIDEVFGETVMVNPMLESCTKEK